MINPTPEYHCWRCASYGIALWRKESGTNPCELRCLTCIEEIFGIGELKPSSMIGRFTAAVPYCHTDSVLLFYRSSHTPYDRFQWWESLPLRQPSPWLDAMLVPFPKIT